MDLIRPFAAPAGRILLALLFLGGGLSKLAAYAATVSYMAEHGVPSVLLPAVIALEVLGALAIIVGWQTRFVALALAVFSVVAAALFHSDFSDPIQQILFMKNVAIAGGFLMLVAHGAGIWSLDNRTKA
ncbi:MAG: DoxX family protein [Panacagrimonas sp.]